MPESNVHQDGDDKHNIDRKADSRAMEAAGEKRSGSDSNAHHDRKHARLHENHGEQNQPLYEEAEVTPQELRPHSYEGADHGPHAHQGAISAYDLKEMYTLLADLRDDELKSIAILTAGTRLDESAPENA